jgi:hemerythrin
MAIEWSPRLAVGVERIDSQHRELFDRVNRLLAAMESQRGEPEIRRMLSFLGGYVVSHFGTEEQLMQQHRYPDFPAHQRLHAEFVKDFVRLRERFDKQGPSAPLAIELNRRVCDWLIDHVGRTDRTLGAFLSKSASREAPPA